MLECGRISVELFPIELGNQRLHMFEQWCARKRRQHLKEGKRWAQIDSVIDCSSNAFDRIREEADHEEAFGVDPFVAAIGDDFVLVFWRDGPSSDAL